LARTLVDAGQTITLFFTGSLSDCRRAHWRNACARAGINFLSLSDDGPVSTSDKRPAHVFEESWNAYQHLKNLEFRVIHFQDWRGDGFWSIKAKRVGLAFNQTVLAVTAHSCTRWITEQMRQFSADPITAAKVAWAEAYAMKYCDQLLAPGEYMRQWL